MNTQQTNDDRIVYAFDTRDASRTFDDVINVAFVNRDNARVRALHVTFDTHDMIEIVDACDVACDDTTTYARIDNTLYVVNDATRHDDVCAQSLRSMRDTMRAYDVACAHDREDRRLHTIAIVEFARAFDDAMGAFDNAVYAYRMNCSASNYSQLLRAMLRVQCVRNERDEYNATRRERARAHTNAIEFDNMIRNSTLEDCM